MFCERLKELRKATGKTVRQVAQEIGICVRTYTDYEQGVREPHLEKFCIICDYYNVSCDYILDIEKNSFCDNL